MGVKKTKPALVPRHHEITVDEIVEKGRKAAHASKKRIIESKALTHASRKLIEQSRNLRKKK